MVPSRFMPNRNAVALLLAVVALTTYSATAQGEIDFASTINTIDFRPEVGTGIYGLHLTGNLGVTSLGVRVFDQQWLLSWNGSAEMVLGGVAYELTAFVIYGVQGQAHAEGGLRLMKDRELSPYLSAGLDGSLYAITQWGNPFNDITINNLDGLGGVVGMIGARLGVGASYLDSKRSLVVEAQPLAEFDGAEPFRGALSYFGAALHARYDFVNTLTAIGDASFALTPTYANTALGTSSETSRWLLSASAIHTWGRFSGGLGLSVGRSETRLAFSSGQTYVSDAPIDSRIWLLVGFWP